MPNKTFVYNDVLCNPTKLEIKGLKKEITSHLLIGQLHDDDI